MSKGKLGRGRDKEEWRGERRNGEERERRKRENVTERERRGEEKKKRLQGRELHGKDGRKDKRIDGWKEGRKEDDIRALINVSESKYKIDAKPKII